MVLPSESTLRSAAPSLGSDELASLDEHAVILAGGTLVELHPPRVGLADVLVRGAMLAQVGGTMPEGTPRVDVSGCIVTPAFTVSHTHLYMALAGGMPPPPKTPRTLTDHLQWIWWALDKALDDELVHTSALAGAAMAAKAGAACIVDLHSSPRSIEGSLDQVEAALDRVGVRGVLAYETSDREGRARRDAALRENRRFLRKVAGGHSAHRAPTPSSCRRARSTRSRAPAPPSRRAPARTCVMASACSQAPATASHSLRMASTGTSSPRHEPMRCATTRRGTAWRARRALASSPGRRCQRASIAIPSRRASLLARARTSPCSITSR